jgi:hypothetical protein
VKHILQRAGVKTAEDEVTVIRNPSSISDHCRAEILKKMSPLPPGRQSKWTSGKGVSVKIELLAQVISRLSWREKANPVKNQKNRQMKRIAN